MPLNSVINTSRLIALWSRLLSDLQRLKIVCCGSILPLEIAIASDQKERRSLLSPLSIGKIENFKNVKIFIVSLLRFRAIGIIREKREWEPL